MQQDVGLTSGKDSSVTRPTTTPARIVHPVIFFNLLRMATMNYFAQNALTERVRVCMSKL